MTTSPTDSLHMGDLQSEAINVVVRCRGRNEREISLKSDIVVDVPDKTGSKEVSINTTNDNSIVGKITAKTFTVDQVFGPGANQELVFNNVALPLFEDFLKGFNCTIFAYGQTGTGKTHTMCGDDRTLNGSYSANAGIIPRILFKLFDSLENDPKVNKDYVIKCSLVEIYNETLKDLLNTKSKKELRIYEEQIKTIPGKPDKSAVFIKNLEEVCVRDAMDGLALLHKGSIDRKTSSTNMNKSSSRSHTIFSISLYRRDKNSEDDLYRFSKINLVDLAGSENISRSGATDIQAKEAGSINRSLLSLGKVINALVDNNLPPYRDSKLTRLLKDSLGGETKTVLIANISPSSMDCDETAKTLEYASKAKNVMNTPQVGSFMLKHVVVKDLVDEVSKLRKDLMSCWAKDGITMHKDNYEQMKKDLQHYKIQVDEINRKLEFQQNQNKILDHDLNLKISEVNLSKEKLKEMNQVNSILNGKVQKQQNSERMLYDSTKKYKELISLFDSGVNDFEAYQKKTNGFLKNKIHDNLQLQSLKLVEMAEKNINFNLSSVENTQRLKDFVAKMIDNFQESAFQICDNATESLTANLPGFFQSLKTEIEKMTLMSNGNFELLNKNLDEMNTNNAKMNKYLSQSLFKNHDELLKRQVELIKIQNENSKREFMSSLSKLVDRHYEKIMENSPTQINDLCKQIIDSEKDLLAGTKFDWLDTNLSKLQNSQSIIKDMISTNENNRVGLNNKIDELSDVTSDSKLIFEDERKKIVEMINNLKSDSKIVDLELAKIDENFDKTAMMRQETLENVLSVAENVSKTCQIVYEKSKQTFTLNQEDKISQLVNTIENNQKMIDSTISIPKSRNVSPIRQLTPRRGNLPTRLRHTSPIRSISGSRPPTTSRPGSRSASRSASRATSPIRQPSSDDQNNKENIMKKRKSINGVDDAVAIVVAGGGGGGSDDVNLQPLKKKLKPFPPSNIKARQYQSGSGSLMNRRPFR